MLYKLLGYLINCHPVIVLKLVIGTYCVKILMLR